MDNSVASPAITNRNYVTPIDSPILAKRVSVTSVPKNPSFISSELANKATVSSVPQKSSISSSDKNDKSTRRLPIVSNHLSNIQPRSHSINLSLNERKARNLPPIKQSLSQTTLINNSSTNKLSSKINHHHRHQNNNNNNRNNNDSNNDNDNNSNDNKENKNNNKNNNINDEDINREVNKSYEDLNLSISKEFNELSNQSFLDLDLSENSEDITNSFLYNKDNYKDNNENNEINRSFSDKKNSHSNNNHHIDIVDSNHKNKGKDDHRKPILHPPRNSSLSVKKSRKTFKEKDYNRSFSSFSSGNDNSFQYNTSNLYKSRSFQLYNDSSNDYSRVLNNYANNYTDKDSSDPNKKKRVLKKRPARVSSLFIKGLGLNSSQIMKHLITNSIFLDNYEVSVRKNKHLQKIDENDEEEVEEETEDETEDETEEEENFSNYTDKSKVDNSNNNSNTLLSLSLTSNEDEDE
jgi:hypothetical protein